MSPMVIGVLIGTGLGIVTIGVLIFSSIFDSWLIRRKFKNRGNHG